jgi:hypothetical protein
MSFNIPWPVDEFLADVHLIIPPAAPLSPYSRLTPAHCGKTPGLPTPDGWTGFPDWPTHRTTRRELEGWIKLLDGAPFNVGMNSRNLHAVDVDTTDRDFARATFNVLWQQMPDAMKRFGIRVGRAPGFLIPFIPEQPRKKQRILFEKTDDSGEKAAVEMLGVGQQFVIGGQHPCGAQYLWGTVHDGDEFDALMDSLPPANWGLAN